ncbi:MAG: 2,3-bisphosphoglycerate-independent phosphoglycerate mutase [Candidatus Parcubacteria bacterium]|nr:MAG: 2,3-bisphosphoglycerate-independent phosphoglycerate mutase [Candidatus Parcubacteria bacterium]
MNKENIILLILDGFGIGEANISNPFRFAKTTYLDYLKKNYPYCLLSASGVSIGLPNNEPGTCEIGHLTMGTGIIYYQNFTRIELAIDNGDFFNNKKLMAIINNTKKLGSRLHLVGLLTSGVAKSSFRHLLSLLRFCQKQNFKNVYLHLFSDGIDSPPRSALNLLIKLQDEIIKNNLPGKIATMCGRFYALDESGNYILRTQKVFLLLTEGIGKTALNPIFVFQEKYQDYKFNDDLLEPFIFDKEGIIKDNDSVLFFNFENKSIRQLAEAFLDPNFQKFKRPTRQNLIISSLTRYLENIDYPIIFEEPKIITNLSRFLSENRLKQLKIIDESRQDLLKFYFNGFIEEEHPNEFFKFFPPFETKLEKIIDQGKEMIDYLIFVINEGDFNFIVINLGVFDLIGHKGNFQEAIRIIEVVDDWLREICQSCLEKKYKLIITSDHGNIEKMINPQTGQLDTSNNSNPVPFWLIGESFKLKKERTITEINSIEKKIWGSLVDIPTTIISLFNLEKPVNFEGKNLLNYLR